MKKTTLLAVLATTALGLAACNQESADAVKDKADDAKQAVEWTKPDDLHFDPMNPKTGLGGLRPGGWNAAFADGHVQFISDNIDAAVLNALFTRAGREVIETP